VRLLKEEAPSPAFALLQLAPHSGGRGVKLGLYVSLSGISDFQKIRGITRHRARRADGQAAGGNGFPYLAPEPWRGKPCEPAYVARTAQVLAEVKGVSFDEIARVTTENFLRLFSKCPVIK